VNAGANICILGGTGFVGTRLVGRLAADGHRLRVPTRNRAARARLLVRPEVTLIQADVHDPDTLERLVEDCGVVINLVGILNERGRDGAGFKRAHTRLAARLAVACDRQGVGKLVHISALKADPEYGPSHYLRTKGEAEQIISAAETPWTILQPSVLYGLGDAFVNRFARLLRRIPVMFPLAMPGARFAPVHVDDVVAAICTAAGDPATDRQRYQLCGPQAHTLRELVDMIGQAIGVRRHIIGLPKGLSRLQAALLDFFPGKPFSTDNYLSLTVHSLCTTDGFAELGIRPVAFASALPECLDLLRARTPLDSYRRQAQRRSA